MEAVARAAAEGRRVRVSASGHSFTDIACTDDVMLRLDALDAGVDDATERGTAFRLLQARVRSLLRQRADALALAPRDDRGAVLPGLAEGAELFDGPSQGAQVGLLAAGPAGAFPPAEAIGRLPEGLRDRARLVFTAHSIPLAMQEGSSPWRNGYVVQLRRVAGLVADRVGRAEWDLVWQSRSGPPHVPWLEPDVCDHLRELAKEGVPAVVLVPIGFVTDHMEVPPAWR